MVFLFTKKNCNYKNKNKNEWISELQTTTVNNNLNFHETDIKKYSIFFYDISLRKCIVNSFSKYLIFKMKNIFLCLFF